nr:YidC/Oxa1 family insertase periplasmic-domain containing protein [Planctomycetota bacterium]
MRVVMMLLALLLAPAWAADSDAAPAAEVANASARDAAEQKPDAGADPKPTWTHVTIANAEAKVELSTYRASIARMFLLSQHPVKLPKWLHQEHVDTTQPLAILDAFDPVGDMHGFIEHMGLPTRPTDPEEGAWTIEPGADGTQAAFTLAIPAKGLSYRMQYRMDQSKPQVHVMLTVANTGAKEWQVRPKIDAIHGIHQDDPTVEAGYQRVVFHAGGAQGKLDYVDFPKPETGGARDGAVDYAGLKSRFFAAWLTPEGVSLVAPAVVGATSTNSDKDQPDLRSAAKPDSGTPYT